MERVFFSFFLPLKPRCILWSSASYSSKNMLSVFLALLFQHSVEKEMGFVARKMGEALPGFKSIGLFILNSENRGGIVTDRDPAHH